MEFLAPFLSWMATNNLMRLDQIICKQTGDDRFGHHATANE
jgi:hypothetical protein